MTKKPETFNFSEWFGGGDVPEVSVDVFTATHLVGEITALQRRITDNDAVAAAERSLADDMDEDEAALAQLLQEFADSRRTFYLRGLDQDARTAIRKAHEASRQPDGDFALRCVAASTAALRKPGGERTPLKLTLSTVKKLHKQLGEGQMAQLFEGYQQATSGIPNVDADFLLRRSGQGNTEE